jgi:hypothetical protein
MKGGDRIAVRSEEWIGFLEGKLEMEVPDDPNSPILKRSASTPYLYGPENEGEL